MRRQSRDIGKRHVRQAVLAPRVWPVRILNALMSCSPGQRLPSRYTAALHDPAVGRSLRRYISNHMAHATHAGG